MVNQDYTHLALVIDRSGSMQSIKSDMEGAIQNLLDEQAKLPGKLIVDVTLFDTKLEFPVVGETPDKIETAGLIDPRGMTALFDAIGVTTAKLGERLAQLDETERPGHVLVATVTDGHENSSREFDASAVKALIKTQTDEFSWDFIFLGANIDAAAVGATFGLAEAQTMNYTADATGSGLAGAAMSGYVTQTRSHVKPKLKQDSSTR